MNNFMMEKLLEFVCVIFIFLSAHTDYVLAQAQFGCNIPRAEECIARLQAQYDAVISQPRQDLAQLEVLCLGTIKGNRLTECVLEATQTCDWNQPWVAGLQWGELHKDIQGLCDRVCPGYPERIRNASLCAHGVQFEDADRGHYNSFCRSLSNSLRCARRMEMDCAFSMTGFLTELFPIYVKNLRSVCEKGCSDIDRVLNGARNCTATYDIERAPRWGNHTVRCGYYFGLMDCLRRSQGMDTCLNLEESLSQFNYNFSNYVYEHRQICSATTTALISTEVVVLAQPSTGEGDGKTNGAFNPTPFVLSVQVLLALLAVIGVSNLR